MSLSPPLTDAPRRPVTTLVALGAAGASVWWWMGHDVQALLAAPGSPMREPWRLVTAVFPHMDPIHLLFNLWWWWFFGARIEKAWGSARLLGITVLLAACSSAAELAFGHTGVGLSGVGYGLFGLLYFAQGAHPALEGSVNQKTVQLFVAWFVACAVLTMANVWHVGNIAHGAGALVGGLLGRVIVAAPERQRARIGALGAVVAVIVSIAVRPPGGMGQAASWNEKFELADSAIKAGQLDKAERLMRDAVAEEPNRTEGWTDLGIVLGMKKQFQEEREMYRRSLSLNEAKRAELAPAIVSSFGREALEMCERGDFTGAEAVLQESLKFNANDATTTEYLGVVRQRANRHNEALPFYLKAVELDPERREKLAPAIASILRRQAYDAEQLLDYAGALKAAKESLAWKADDAYTLGMVRRIEARMSGSTEEGETSPPP